MMWTCLLCRMEFSDLKDAIDHLIKDHRVSEDMIYLNTIPNFLSTRWNEVFAEWLDTEYRDIGGGLIEAEKGGVKFIIAWAEVRSGVLEVELAFDGDTRFKDIGKVIDAIRDKAGMFFALRDVRYDTINGKWNYVWTVGVSLHWILKVVGN